MRLLLSRIARASFPVSSLLSLAIGIGAVSLHWLTYQTEYRLHRTGIAVLDGENWYERARLVASLREGRMSILRSVSYDTRPPSWQPPEDFKIVPYEVSHDTSIPEALNRPYTKPWNFEFLGFRYFSERTSARKWHAPSNPRDEYQTRYAKQLVHVPLWAAHILLLILPGAFLFTRYRQACKRNQVGFQVSCSKGQTQTES